MTARHDRQRSSPARVPPGRARGGTRAPEATEQHTDGVEGQRGGEEPDERLGDDGERRDLDAFDEDEKEEADREAEQ